MIQPKPKPAVEKGMKRAEKSSIRHDFLREWLLADCYVAGQRYDESAAREHLDLPRSIDWERALNQAKVSILREYQLRKDGDDRAVSFEENSYLDIIRSQRNLTRLSGELYATQDRLAKMIATAEADITRLSGAKRKSTELAETKRLLTQILDQQASSQPTLLRLEKDRQNLARTLLEQQRKIAKDARSADDDGKRVTGVSIAMANVPQS